MIDVALVTQQTLLSCDEHVQSRDRDSMTLMSIFQEKNLTSQRVAWDDASVDWSTIKVAFISSTWNYQKSPGAFRTWINQVESAGCRLVNSPSLIRWNMNKGYLLQLQDVGINIPESYVLRSLHELKNNKWIQLFGTTAVVVKPTISASAQGTYYIDDFTAAVKDENWCSMPSNHEVIVQPFLRSIKTKGEVSLIYINGEFTHAKLKRPTADEFRVQQEWGGTLLDYLPTGQELDFGQSVIQACMRLQTAPVYARVDVCYDNQNALALMELELIEPELWLISSEKARLTLAKSLTNLV